MTQEWLTAPPLFLPDSWGCANLLSVCICSQLFPPQLSSPVQGEFRHVLLIPHHSQRGKQVSRQRKGGGIFPSLNNTSRLMIWNQFGSYQTPQIPITKLRLTFQRVISKKNLDKIRWVWLKTTGGKCLHHSWGPQTAFTVRIKHSE